MKHHYIYLIIFLFTGFSSCKKFLTTKPTDSLSPEYYYETEAQLNTALIGVYDPLSLESTYGNNFTFELVANTDETFFSKSSLSGASGAVINSYDYTNPRISELWSAMYLGIERANILIANINKATIDEAKRKNILAQAQFLRGYYYFLLVSNFGGVPMRLSPLGSVNDVNLPRTSAKEVYAQVLKDMKEAEPNLATATTINTCGKISRTTCQGVLARVCLTMAGYPLNDNEKYAEALDWAKKVEASGEHALRTTFAAPATSAYSQIFINESRDIYDVKEVLWEAEFSGNRFDGFTEAGRLGNLGGIALPTEKPDSIGLCYGFINATARYYRLFGNGDLRRDWTIAPYFYRTTDPAYPRIAWGATTLYNRNIAKWRRSFETLVPKNKNYTPTNFPILRYSDVLLMIAESENAVNGPTTIAYAALNQVRRRAYGLPLNVTSAITDAPSGMDKAAFLAYIQDERARELAYENLRRTDLIRWGIYVQTMNEVGNEFNTDPLASSFRFGSRGGLNIVEKHLLYPIPSSEMNVNKAITAADQNPGW